MIDLPRQKKKKTPVKYKMSQDEIDRVREREGLHVIVKGKRRCLRCDKKFMSEDIKTNRICNNCSSLGARWF